VLNREYEPWKTAMLIVDTAKNSVDESTVIILSYLNSFDKSSLKGIK
jgi:hypothetical protein